MNYDELETILPLAGGNTLHFPSYPDPCSYVAVCDQNGMEIAYWDAEEWAEEPESVMGAIMGALCKIHKE